MKTLLMVFLAALAVAAVMGRKTPNDAGIVASAIEKLRKALCSELLYRKGELYLEQDYIRRGLNCYFRAAALGNAKALYTIATFYENGNHLAPCGKTAARLRAESAPGLAARARRGDPEAQLLLSLYYMGDDGDLRLAKHWAETAFRNFKRQAEAGDAYACVKVGKFYEEAFFQEVAPETAIGWYRKAAELGFWDGITQMGRCCMKGIGTKRDINEMVLWCRRAAASGNISALAALGVFHENGIGTTRDRRKAFECYRAAAEQGHPPAMFSLGRCYEGGIGVDADREKAIFWYRNAAADGFADAKKHLSALTGAPHPEP